MANTSIKEVARLAEVSTATVSRSLNSPEKVNARTRAKVQAAIAQTGYAPNKLAQSFRRGRTNLVMVVVPSVGDPFFAPVMRGIRVEAAREGYSVLIKETGRESTTANDLGALVVSKQTDGIILLASVSPFGPEPASAGTQHLPLVIGCETVSPSLAGFASVHIDNIAAAQEATDHLIARGHTRIALIHGATGSLLTRDRERGYRKAMKRAKLPIAKGWMVTGELSIAGARSATRQLLNHSQAPTAIFCATDEMALGCLHEVKATGRRVPRDISIVGFDDIRYAEVADPPLTTISQPAEEIGARVMRRLLRHIEEEQSGVRSARSTSSPEIVPHKLVERRSVAPPRFLSERPSRAAKKSRG